MESPNLIIGLTVLFVLIGVGGSLVYYFARYYVRTSSEDKELFSKGLKAVDLSGKKDLVEALSKTRESLWGRISLALPGGGGEVKPQVREELEEILFSSDLGPTTADMLMQQVSSQLSRSERGDSGVVRTALREKMRSIFRSAEGANLFASIREQTSPSVWMIVGVNGVGKTTTIGKLASQARAQGLKTLIVAGDTFRAAADSQLRVWAQRAGCEIFNPEQVKDPSAVAYSGLEKAFASGAQLVLVDTAGRLHTQGHLMEELKKMKRVMGKVREDLPQERILVVDANAGQNALVQARQFHEAVGLTGVIITKMDGSSKAGVAVGIANEIKVPIHYIGIGESVEDLRPFDAQAFVEAIL